MQEEITQFLQTLFLDFEFKVILNIVNTIEDYFKFVLHKTLLSTNIFYSNIFTLATLHTDTPALCVYNNNNAIREKLSNEFRRFNILYLYFTLGNFNAQIYPILYINIVIFTLGICLCYKKYTWLYINATCLWHGNIDTLLNTYAYLVVVYL